MLIAAGAGSICATDAVAQDPGTNGILTWHSRLPTGYKQGDDGIQGVEPVPSGQASGAKTLFPGFTRAVWSPDGKSALLEKRGFGTGQIYLWTAAKGVSSGPTVTAPAGWGGVGNATWSPDGKRFAYLAFDSGNIAYGQIWEANADGSNPHQLYPISRVFLGLSWGRTPSGDRIAIVSACEDDPAGNNYFKICTFDPNAPAQPAVPVPVPGSTDPMFFYYVSSVDWSPDGSGELLVSAHPTVQGGDPKACNGNPCQGGTVCDRVTTVCYINGEILVLNSQTGAVRNVTDTETFAGPYESSAVWSPDGTEIAYLSAGPKAWTSVWVANYTGGSKPQISNRRLVSPPAPMTDAKYFGDPSWQPCVNGVTNACTTSALSAPNTPPSKQPPAGAAGAGSTGVVVSGSVSVTLPGASSAVPLRAGTALPAGAVVDASVGAVRVRGADGKDAVFSRGAFKLGPAAPVTQLSLVGGDFSVCKRKTATASAAKPRVIRRLWGNGKGRFRTQGRFAAATVRGTVWEVEDACEGTVVHVRRGLVEVRDRRTGKVTVAKAGGSVTVPA